MASEVKVSIIIPVYNTEKFLSRCLDSLQKQTLHDLEIIIINDQTPDNSMQIATEFAKKDSRIRILENSQNMGPMWSRREGYSRAKGEYIVFCDSDDYFPIDALKILYETAQTNGSDLVIGAYTYLSISGEEKTFRTGAQQVLSQEDLYKALLTGKIPHSLCAKIYHRRLFDGFDYETFIHHTNGEDMILLYQLVNQSHKIIIIEDSTYYYCQNALSITQNNLSEKKKGAIVYSLNWLYNFMKNKTDLVDLLNQRVLKIVFFLLLNNISTKNLNRLNKEFMKKMRFPFLYKQLGLFKTIIFMSLLHSSLFRQLYSLKKSKI